MVTAEPGVRLMDFYEAVEKENLFFPPHPGDESATIGGVIATNAGGSRAVKYGVVRNFVKGLEVVLPDGGIIQLGGKVLKNSTGYSLLHLMIGSEGTLGIVTKAIFNLLPPPKTQITLIAPFNDLENAIRVVPALAKAGILPMAVEFIEDESIKVAEDFMKKKWPCQEGKAHLMIILDGTSDDEVLNVAQQIGTVCGEFGARDVFVADTQKKQREILEIRSNIYETIKKYVIEILDIALPPSAIPGHVNTVHTLSREYNMWLPTFGHAADGNVHTLPLRAHYLDGKWKEIPDSQWKKIYPQVRKALHDDAANRGGLVSGEHGIGLVKKEYLPGAIGENVVEKMRLIKKVFDPNNILNPGKVF
jgi:glycolate oxidase